MDAQSVQAAGAEAHGACAKLSLNLCKIFPSLRAKVFLNDPPPFPPPQTQGEKLVWHPGAKLRPLTG